MKAQIVYWRDIPAQVIVRLSRREQVKEVLDERFEKAIDRAAMKAGLHGADGYLEQWRRCEVPIEGTEAAKIAQNLRSRLETQFSAEVLQSLIDNKGFQPS